MTKNTLILLLSITFVLFGLNQIVFGEVSRVHMVDTIYENKSVNENIFFEIRNSDRQNFTFVFPDQAKNSKLNSGEVFYENNSIVFPIDCSSLCAFNISYDLEEIVLEDASGITFSRTLNFENNLSNLIYEVNIPKGKVISDSKDIADPPVVPSYNNISTDGQSIKITWVQKNPNLPQLFKIRFNDPEEESGSSSILDSFTRGEIIFAVIIFFGIGISIGFFLTRMFFYRKIKQIFKLIEIQKNREYEKNSYDDKDSIKTIIPSFVLSPQEKAIIKILKENSNVLNQKEIVKILMWSKSKVSAVVSNLESKRIIKKEKIGRSYKVELIQEIQEN